MHSRSLILTHLPTKLAAFGHSVPILALPNGTWIQQTNRAMLSPLTLLLALFLLYFVQLSVAHARFGFATFSGSTHVYYTQNSVQTDLVRSQEIPFSTSDSVTTELGTVVSYEASLSPVFDCGKVWVDFGQPFLSLAGTPVWPGPNGVQETASLQVNSAYGALNNKWPDPNFYPEAYTYALEHDRIKFFASVTLEGYVPPGQTLRVIFFGGTGADFASGQNVHVLSVDKSWYFSAGPFEIDYYEETAEYFSRDWWSVAGGGTLFMQISQTTEFPINDPNTETGWITGTFSLAPQMTFAGADTGDFNGDGEVDAADYVLWRRYLGSGYTDDHYNTWLANFGTTTAGAAAVAHSPLRSSVPEPSTLTLATLAIVSFVRRRGRLPNPS